MNNEPVKLAFDYKIDPVIFLHSGEITCLYQHGKLRYIRFDGKEIVRSIYTALRDDSWNTAPYEITDEKIQQRANGFSINYTAHYAMDFIRYTAEISIEANNNSLHFSMKGRSLSSFKSNRIGICLLNNTAAISGKEVRITMPSGESYTRIFPGVISPHQPVKDVQAMQWEYDNITTNIKFTGDIFETEDQRNWTDSSFKTYSRPLSLPYPFEVKPGDVMEQEMHLEIHTAGAEKNAMPAEVRLTRAPIPSIGYSKPPGSAFTLQQMELLKKIPFAHMRVELDLTSNTWQDEWSTAAKEATVLDTKLKLVCFFGKDVDQDLKKLNDALARLPHIVQSLLALDKSSGRSSQAFSIIYNEIKQKFPETKVGYGTNGHFADLNRNLPSVNSFDFVSFGVTPQAHSTDTISLLENLDNQVDNISTLKHHLGNVPIHVSPVTFKGRKSALFAETDAPADFDERQHIQLGAAWIIKCLRNFSGTEVTLFDATGYKGIVNSDHIQVNKPSPLYELLRQLKQFGPTHFVTEGHHDDLRIVMENNKGEQFVILLDEHYANYRAYLPVE